MVSSTVELHQKYGDRLAVIGMDAAEDVAVVRPFVEQNGMTYLNLIADVETMQAYELRAHPLTLFIAPGGEVFSSHLGFTDGATLERDARRLLGLE